MSSLVAVLIVLALSVTGAEGAHKLRVVTTIPDLKSLVEEVGGDLVDVESLARGTQNAHEVEVRPSLMLRLRRADLFFENGLELDAWSDVAVQGANNPKIVRGAPGRVDVSRGVQVLEVPSARVDRSMGDVQAPELRATFEKNRAAFLARLEEAMVRWTKTLEPVRGAKIVVYHPDYIYFLTRFGIVQAGMVEDRPGIPPSPQHLAQLIRQMKDERINIGAIDYNVTALAQALR